ncbi:MAG: ATP-binding cassette domain-containing protein [Deltaproteobacteria bacterium]|nr:ATP-binding cassette domain-containing protein [Deltaproteobacteria bacterium]
MSDIFEIKHLQKEFDGKRVLSISHLAFEQGRIYCLFGGNGSGKTTLFELLTLVQMPTRGTICFRGKEVYPAADGVSLLRDAVTLVHQNPLLFDTTVEKNVDYGLRVRKVGQAERRQRTLDCLALVGLSGFQQRKARQLSGGETQRVAIARALAINPQVLLLDEFSANVDTENRAILEKIILNINRELGTTIIFTTHYLDQAYRLSGDVIHLFHGKVTRAHMHNMFRGEMKIDPREGMVFENEHLCMSVKAAQAGKACIAVPVEAITLSHEPLRSSMRNCFKGKITHIVDEGKKLNVRVNAGEMFEALITRESFRQMGLEPGCEVYVNFKASAVEIY